MKTLLIIIATIIVMVLLGWITFSNSENDAGITIDKQEIKEDTAQAVEEGKKLINEGKEVIDQAGEKVEQEAEEIDNEVDIDTDDELDENDNGVLDANEPVDQPVLP